MSTPIWLTGFEYGFAPTVNGGGLFNSINGTPAVVTDPVHGGIYALQLAPNASLVNVQKSFTAMNVMVIRGYLRFNNLPASSCDLMYNNATVGNAFRLRYYYSTNKWGVCWGPSEIDAQSSTMTVSTGVWYRFDIRITVNTNPRTIEWKVDGFAQTTSSSSETGSTTGSLFLGSNATSTYTCYYDDIFVSSTSGDWPVGGGVILGKSPNADGTHNNPANTLEDQTGADINGTTIFAWSLLNDIPMNSLANYVRQAPISTTSYVEVQFDDITQTNISGVEALLAYHSATASTNYAACIIRRSDSTEIELYGTPAVPLDMSEVSLFYKSVIVTPPGGGWTMSEVNALRARMGYASDATPDPYWDALLLEVAVVTADVSVIDLSGYGIASGEVFGTPALVMSQVVGDVGNIASGEAFGTAIVTAKQIISNVGNIASGEILGSLILTMGAVNIQPVGIAGSEAFGNATFSPGVVNVQPGGIVSSEIFGALVLTVGEVNILPVGIASQEVFGTPTVFAAGSLVQPVGIESQEVFGTADVWLSLKIIFPTGIPSSEVFGALSITTGAVSVQPAGIGSSEVLGSLIVVVGAVDIQPAGIVSEEACGVPQVQVGTVVIQPTGIDSGQAFGTLILSVGAVNVQPAGISSDEVFGSVVVTSGQIWLQPIGITSQEAVGQPILQVGAVAVQPSSIGSGEVFGVTALIPGVVIIVPVGISSSETFGTPTIRFLFEQNIYVTGCISEEAFGVAQVFPGPVILSVQGIAGQEIFGMALLFIFAPELSSAETFVVFLDLKDAMVINQQIKNAFIMFIDYQEVRV